MATQCLAAAVESLEQRGLSLIWGPMQFSIWHSYRLMTRGFSAPPFIGEPRNPPYYPAFFEAAGFSPLAQWRSWDLTQEELSTLVAAASAMPPGLLAEQGLHVATYEAARFDQLLRDFHLVANESFKDNLGYAAIELDEFSAVFSPMKPLLQPELVLVLYDGEERPQGLAYCYPDPRCGVVLHTMALLPAVRGKGVVSAFAINGAIRAARDWGQGGAVGALAKEGRTLYDKIGAPSREYTLFELRRTGSA